MIGFSGKNIGITAWLFSVFFFLVYMLNADCVYYALSGKSYVVKLPDTFSLHARGDLKRFFPDWLDHYPINNKFEEGKGLRGQIDTVANKSGNAKARIFLRSADVLYEVIENRQSFWADPMKVVVDFFTSTAKLEKGIYTIGLYVHDDEGERFVWMKSCFEKAAGGPVEYVARPVPVAPAMASKDVRFDLEQIDTKNKECILLQGWVVLENAEMDDYNAYIRVWDSNNIVKAFYAPLFTRWDIASLYADSRSANSGFRISIPRDEFSPGKYTVKVISQSRKTGEVLESMQAETIIF